MRTQDSAGERTFAFVLALSLCFPAAARGDAKTLGDAKQRGDAKQQGTAPSSSKNDSSAATISVNVDLVILHATVTNGKGGLVSGLQKQDFSVYEDGQPQTIGLFQHEDIPVAVGLVVDNSGSMKRKRSDVAAAALAFVRSSNPEDEMFIVNFNEHVTFGLPNTKLFSAQASELAEALIRLPPGGKTALYDAIDAGLVHLQQASRKKKVLIVISDGGDNASKDTLRHALQAVVRSDATIYTIGLFDEYDKDRNPRVLNRIARATGGEAFLLPETSAVVKICQGIAQDIRNQYTIGYAPANHNLDGSYRRIRVRAAAHHGGKLFVRARDGYIATPDRNAPPAGSQEDIR